MRRTALCIGALFAAMAAASAQEPLVVTGDVVNLRARPDLGAPVVLQVRRDAQVTGLSREGEWVEVRLGEQNVQGWMHGSLLEPAREPPEVAATEPAIAPESLERFRSSVDYLDRRAGSADVDLFAGVRPLGPGAVQVVATDAWKTVSSEEQAGYLESLFDRWLAAASSVEPLRLEIVDSSGAVLMAKSGP